VNGRTAVLAAGAFAAGFAAEQAVMRRVWNRVDPFLEDDLAAPPDADVRVIEGYDGSRIHITERGDGPPIVLLHGITLQTAVWHYQLVDLSDRFRVVGLDWRGHGGSAAGRDGYGLDRLARDLGTVLTELDLRDAVVVGHSMGGMALMQFCADCPDLLDDRVAGLVFLSTSPGAFVPAMLEGAIRAWGERRFSDGHLTRHPPRLSYRMPPNDLSFLLARLAFGKRPSATHVDFVRAMVGLIPNESSIPSGFGLVYHDAREALRNTRTRSLVVVGSHDFLTPTFMARSIDRALPNGELRVIRGAGHHVMLERRTEFAELLAQFAGEVQRSRVTT
jgi:pimeloyl-ACP methyl ester carboxylesterase